MASSLIGAAIGTAIAATSTAISTAYSADQQKKAADEQRRAQEEAQRKQQLAQEKAAREAAARTPAELKQRDYSVSDNNASRLRGIQATMLASRKAQSPSAGGKTHLGE